MYYMSYTTFVISMIIGFVLATIFGLYLRLCTITEYHDEFGKEEKSYIKYAPIVFVKVIRKAIKTKDKRILKFCLTNLLTLYTIIGISYCIMCGDFDLTYGSLNNLINVYRGDNKK